MQRDPVAISDKEAEDFRTELQALSQRHNIYVTWDSEGVHLARPPTSITADQWATDIKTFPTEEELYP